MFGVAFPWSDFVFLYQVWEMRASSPRSPFYLENQGRRNIEDSCQSRALYGIFRVHILGGHQMLARRFVRLEVHGAAVGTMPHGIMASDTSFVVGFTTVKKSIVASLSLRITVLSSQQVNGKYSASNSVVCTVNGAAHKLTEKDLVFANSSDLFLGIDPDSCSSISWIVLILTWGPCRTPGLSLKPFS